VTTLDFGINKIFELIKTKNPQFVYIYVCLYVCECVCYIMCVHVFVILCVLCVHVYMYKCKYVVYVYVCLYVYMYVNTYIYICTIHMFMCMYIHTQIHVSPSFPHTSLLSLRRWTLWCHLWYFGINKIFELIETKNPQFVDIYVCLYMCVHVFVILCVLCVHVYMYRCKYVVYVYVCLYVYMHVHIYTYICTIHMFMCMYIHTQIHVSPFFPHTSLLSLRGWTLWGHWWERERLFKREGCFATNCRVISTPKLDVLSTCWWVCFLCVIPNSLFTWVRDYSQLRHSISMREREVQLCV